LSNTQFRFVYTGGAGTVIGPAVDTKVHRFKAWSQGSTCYLVVDNTLYTGTGGPLVADVGGVGLGGGVNAGASNTRIAFLLHCSSKPTLVEEIALDDWAKAYWGAP